MTEREAGTGSPGRRTTVALVLGVAAVLASWIPVVGLGLGAAAVATALQARKAARRAGALEGPTRTRLRRALGVGAFGLVLGLGFTVAWKACTPAEETPAEGEQWEEFERAFEPPAPGGGTGAAPAEPREPATPPAAPAP